MNSDKKWPSDWIRAVLSACVLQTIAGRGEAYGYQIVQELKSAGFDGLSGGTVYPVLSRLESDGLVRSEWREGVSGPGKKFYFMTTEGHDWLIATARSWTDFAAITKNLLNAKESE